MKFGRFVSLLLVAVCLLAVLPGGYALPAHAQGPTPRVQQKPPRPPGYRAPSVPQPKSRPTQPLSPFATTAAPPANDSFNGAIGVTALPYGHVEDVTGATVATDDPNMGCGNPENDQRNYQTVWFRFVAPISGEVQANSFDSTYDTVMAAFTGTRGHLNFVDCNDDAGPPQSQITMEVTAGRTYYIEVAAYYAPVAGELRELHFAMDVVGLSLSNSFVQANIGVDPNLYFPGRFALGTRAGEALLSGYPWLFDSSFTTIRVITGTTPTDFRLGESTETSIPKSGPSLSNSVLSTTWETSEFRVQQRLSFVIADDSHFPNTMALEYQLTNLTQAPAKLGARVLYDLQVGDNDGPPFRLPGAGTYTTEHTFTSFPDTWEVSQSPSFEDAGLLGRGILRGTGVTTPDWVTVGRWGDVLCNTGQPGLYDADWSYTADPSADFTCDSAVALYFDTITLAPGESRTIRTYYGSVLKTAFLPHLLKNFR